MSITIEHPLHDIEINDGLCKTLKALIEEHSDKPHVEFHINHTGSIYARVGQMCSLGLGRFEGLITWKTGRYMQDFDSKFIKAETVLNMINESLGTENNAEIVEPETYNGYEIRLVNTYIAIQNSIKTYKSDNDGFYAMVRMFENPSTSPIQLLQPQTSSVDVFSQGEIVCAMQLAKIRSEINNSDRLTRLLNEISEPLTLERL